jgi:hypothetical protein
MLLSINNATTPNGEELCYFASGSLDQNNPVHLVNLDLVEDRFAA